MVVEFRRGMHDLRIRDYKKNLKNRMKYTIIFKSITTTQYPHHTTFLK